MLIMSRVFDQKSRLFQMTHLPLYRIGIGVLVFSMFMLQGCGKKDDSVTIKQDEEDILQEVSVEHPSDLFFEYSITRTIEPTHIDSKIKLTHNLISERKIHKTEVRSYEPQITTYTNEAENSLSVVRIHGDQQETKTVAINLEPQAQNDILSHSENSQIDTFEFKMDESEKKNPGIIYPIAGGGVVLDAGKTDPEIIQNNSVASSSNASISP